ncbi:hypothetical protein [Kibdelosporangium philippinense]|uniref:hypothetical protein n=1 Tax=Kibdelosporangium philippinense TaxID=211113 RepID=UPI00361FED5D
MAGSWLAGFEPALFSTGLGSAVHFQVSGWFQLYTSGLASTSGLTSGLASGFSGELFRFGFSFRPGSLWLCSCSSSVALLCSCSRVVAVALFLFQRFGGHRGSI